MSARRRLPSRLGCALGAGLRLLGSRRWWRTRWWRTRWSVRSATPRGRLFLPGWPSRRRRSRMCRVRAIGSLRSFGWCWLVTSVLLVACSLPPWPAPRLSLSLFLWRRLRPDTISTGCCSAWPSWRLTSGLWRGCRGLGALTAQVIRFSRLLRGPGDPRTATVMASKRGGRTLILDIPWDGTGRGYQPLSEVHLALWTKGGMLVPGEQVTVYGGPGGESPLLISSARRGRAFLGTDAGPVDRPARAGNTA